MIVIYVGTAKIYDDDLSFDKHQSRNDTTFYKYVHGPCWKHCAPRVGRRLDDTAVGCPFEPLDLGMPGQSSQSYIHGTRPTLRPVVSSQHFHAYAITEARHPLRCSGHYLLESCTLHPLGPRRAHLCPPALDIASSMHADVRQPEYFGAGGEQRIRRRF